MTIRGVPGITDESWPATLQVDAGPHSFEVLLRIDTAQEAAQYRHGGIIPHVLRRRWLGGQASGR
jgi:aconitate hydratase